METKTVSGQGEKFLAETIENHERQGWTVDHVTRATLGKFTVMFRRNPGDARPLHGGIPARPD